MRRFFLLFERFDWLLLIAVLSLTVIGLVTIYGIGMSREPIQLFSFYKQLLAFGIGAGLIVLLTWFDFRQLRSLSFLGYCAGLILLTFVLILGRASHGTQGWFAVGNLSFQPVEFSKLALAAYLATFMSRLGHGRLSWRVFAQSGLATALYAGLILLQPDFGSAMVIILMWVAMVLFARLPKRAWIVLPLVCLSLGTLLWTVGLKPYQRDRLLTFANQQTDLRGSGYNAAQARIAIGSGGLFGKGVGEGSQARLRFLPEAATDFIFAVIGEELGFVGVSVAILLFALLLFRLLRIAQESGDDFAALLLVGLVANLLIHIFINMGMNLGIMPITGIPLPFLSSAASSLVMAYLGVGLAESIAVRRRSASHREAASRAWEE